MVNTGKPSAGCYLCRARRVKCDETKPQCRKCQKLGKDCPGYRLGESRDESLKTMNRAIKRVTMKQTSGNLGGGSASSTEEYTFRSCQLQESQLNPRRSGGLQAHPQTPIIHQAACYFLSTYVMVPLKPGGRGVLSFVYKIISSASIEPCFTAAFRAVSISALATQPNYRKLRSVAQAYYLRAIGLVQTAVQDPTCVTDGQTLASVLILALYEILACPNKQLGGYEAHTRGAVQLVQMRGPKQLETYEGVEMVILTRSRFMMLHSLPGVRAELSPSLQSFLKQASHPDAFGRLGDWFNEQQHLRSEVCRVLERGRQNVASLAKVLKLFQETMALAQKFYSIIENCLPESRPSIVWSRQSDSADGSIQNPPYATSFPGPAVHSFKDYWTATFHISSSGSALMLLHLAARCLAYLFEPDDYRTKDEYRSCSDLASRAIGNLVAAAPYFTGLAALTESSQPPPRITVASTMSVFYEALVSDFATPAQKRYLSARLKHLASEGGIAQADVYLKREYHLPGDDIERDQRRRM